MKTKTVKLRKDTLVRKFEKLHKVDKEVKALDAHLKKKGFRAKKEKKNFWGVRTTHEDGDKKATVSVYVQDYASIKSNDGACVGQVAVAVGDRSNIYSFSLVAPEGDFREAREHRVDRDLKVVEADSFWSCVIAYLERQDATAVRRGLDSCLQRDDAGAVLACLAAVIAFPLIPALACCGCNCNWWCSWLGCCRS